MPTPHYSLAELVPRGLYASRVRELLVATRELFAESGGRELNRNELDAALRSIVAAQQVPAGDFFKALRVTLSWPNAVPDLFEAMVALGREGVLGRLDAALIRLTDEASR